MPQSYDLTKLDETSFEHLANFLALRVLGAGHTGFGPGADGGRDGYFEGEAPYPSDANRWSGRWYLQAKYHRPHLSKNPQKWLLARIKEEVDEFGDPRKKREWPDNWIIVTNIEPSGIPETGAFDRARELVTERNSELAKRFHIWGGAKVIQLLILYSDIAEYYAHFLTPGHVLTHLYKHLNDAQASTRSIIRHFVVTNFNEQQFTKLDQAGSTMDTRPGIHRLFTDLPFRCKAANVEGMSIQNLAQASAQNHRIESRISDLPRWLAWRRSPKRARVWFIKGGPGQGKSTVTQYLAQIQRACLILGADAPSATPQQIETAKEIRDTATNSNLWPLAPRVPVYVELKDFAKWFGERQPDAPRGILTFLCDRLSARIQQPAQVGTLKRAFSETRWLFVFDGLDEVPSDVKDSVADEIISFVDDQLIELAADAFFICTSRPQGYSGQFAGLEAAETELLPLDTTQALACAAPVLRIDRDELESAQNLETLKESLQSPSIAEIMTTPLQAHIMAVVVRDGGRPPDRKWRLFTNFYQVIKKREANRNLPDKRISTLLRTGDKLLKALHNRLGYELHARAETSQGAQTSIERSELLKIIQSTVSELQSTNVEETILTLKEATTERLVLVNTPESGAHVRFDIRPMQEFFAAEFVYEDTSAEKLGERIATIADDAHWREVIHFILSALIENSRRTDLAVAVEKLTYLNERDDSSPARFLYRRIAAGAFLAARLLAEGVLEQDKRVRQQFKRTIEPLFGSAETLPNDLLASVTGTDSTSWLIEVLANTLLEQSESESIGASYVLSRLVSDDHSRLNEIENEIIAKSPEYRGCLFQMLGEEVDRFVPEEDQWIPPLWIGRLIFSSLASSEWRRLKRSGVEAAFNVVSLLGDAIPNVARAAGIDAALANLLILLIRNRPSFDTKSNIDLCGVVQLAFTTPNSELSPESWSDETRSAVASASGIFSLLQATFAIASGNRSNDLISILANASEFLEILPGAWSDYLPRELRGASGCSKLLNPIPSQPVSLSWDFKPGCSTAMIVEEDNKAADHARLLRDHPRMALRIFSMAYRRTSGRRKSWQTFQTYLETPEGGDALAAIIPDNIDWLIGAVNFWGLILKLCGPSNNIRQSFLNAGLLWKDQLSYGEIYPFALDLPKEAGLIAPILSSIYCTRNSAQLTVKPSAKQIEEYFPDIALLSEIALGANREQSGMASIAALLHPQCTAETRARLIHTLVDGYQPHRSPLYLPLAAFALEVPIAENQVVAIEAMGTMLRMGNSDFAGRFGLGSIFDDWRERSKAPVTLLGVSAF